jgi:uncharacterized protein
MMRPDTLRRFEIKCREFINSSESGEDSAHDLAHVQRVVTNARMLLQKEVADEEIVVAAAWLHDCVILPKDHPKRSKASTMAAEQALNFLRLNKFPVSKLPGVAHAIEAHSFSAGIIAETTEAKIVQDADRLDALGAIGIARCLMVGGQLGRPLYNPEDPFCDNRNPDDSEWTIDHFYTKLFKLPEMMNTSAAREEAVKRVDFMRSYLEKLRGETGENKL